MSCQSGNAQSEEDVSISKYEHGKKDLRHVAGLLFQYSQPAVTAIVDETGRYEDQRKALEMTLKR